MTSSRTGRRPHNDEYADFFAGYVALVPDGDIITILRDQLDPTLDLLRSVPVEKHDYRYAPDKWTLKQVVGHVMDGEWVFTYRALRFARGDQTQLPGMDQDTFMAHAPFDERSLDDILAEFSHLRQANTTLFDSFGEEVLDRTGIASECRFSVRALLYFNAGHLAHHLNVLQERYL